MEHIATGNAIREQGLLPSGHTEMRVAGSGAEQFPKVAHVGVFGWAILPAIFSSGGDARESAAKAFAHARPSISSASGALV